MVEAHSQPTVPISAIVPAFERTDKCLQTLQRIYGCLPRPIEVIVHVDGNQQGIASRIRDAFPEAQVLCSADRKGPGGARNELIGHATQELVASFDDDSYPLDCDYFQRAVAVANGSRDASIIGAALYH